MTISNELEVIIGDAIEGEDDFCIELLPVWEGVGYSTYQNAVRAMKSKLEENVDWILISNHFGSQIETRSRGRIQSEYLLTKDAFKSFCMMTNSIQGKEVRSYFIAAEKEFRVMLNDRLKINPSPELDAISSRAKQYETRSYRPFERFDPEAAKVFKKNIGVPTVLKVLEPTPETEAPKPPLADSEVMQLISSLSLVANRAGLAGNKSTKEAEFLDKRLDKLRREFAGNESIIAALRAEVIRLDAAAIGTTHEVDNWKRAVASRDKMIATMREDVARNDRLQGHYRELAEKAEARLKVAEETIEHLMKGRSHWHPGGVEQLQVTIGGSTANLTLPPA